MRSTMLALISVVAMAACSNPPATQLDGSVKDLAMNTTPPDLSKKPKAKPNCNSLYYTQGQTPTGLAPASAATQALYTAFALCQFQTCGATDLMDGGYPSKPCAQLADGGTTVSLECQQCFSNTEVNDMFKFQDMNGNEIKCIPTTATSCKACAPQLIACFNDPCNSDADCMGFINPMVCDVDPTSSTVGTCIPM